MRLFRKGSTGGSDLDRRTVCVAADDCGPAAYAWGDFNYTNSGCNFKELSEPNSPNDCDNSCLVGNYGLCLYDIGGACWGYAEEYVGACAGNDIDNDFKRWRVCYDSGVL